MTATRSKSALCIASTAVGFLLLTAPTRAADIPALKAPIAAVAPVAVAWTGFYVGANGGYSWGSLDSSGSGVPAGASNPKVNGPFAGVQAGYNWQFEKLVLGVEGDWQYSWQKGTASSAAPAGTAGSGSNEGKTPFVGTARVRAGWANSKTLYYGTVGLAYGQATQTITTTPCTPVIGGGCLPGSPATSKESDNRMGWTAGGGIEWSFAPNWSAKLEYLHVDLGTASFFSGTVKTKVTDELARAGINYRF